MTKNQQFITELNKFLKGIRMGTETFKTYQEKAKDEKLIQELTSILTEFNHQEEKVISTIKNLDGEPNDNLGIAGEMATMLEKLKNILVNNDKEIIEHAIKAIEMGIEGGTKAVISCEELLQDSHIAKELNYMIKKYHHILKNLVTLQESYQG